MRPTLDFLRDSFSRFNTICFGGKLPEPDFRLSNARSFMGQFRHPRVFSRERCRISLNARYDLPREELEDVVIHEMIHYYIWHARLRDSSSHGPVFRRIMADINTRHRPSSSPPTDTSNTITSAPPDGPTDGASSPSAPARASSASTTPSSPILRWWLWSGG